MVTFQETSTSERRVLCVIYDPALALSHISQLEDAGYTTLRTSDLGEALGRLSRQDHGVVVIGHLVPRDHAETITAAARVNRMAVVRLASRKTLQATGADVTVDVREGPSALVSALEQVARRQ